MHVGTEPGSETLSISLPSQTDHRADVSGLQTATQYFYKITCNGVMLAGGDRLNYFITGPSDGDEPFNVWAIGDSGISSGLASGEHPYQAAVRDAFLNAVPVEYLAFMVHLGDIAYAQGTDLQFQRGFFSFYDSILRRLTSWPTQGNHDLTENAYYSVFSLPRSAQAGGVASGTEYYYSWDYGNAHFISLNSEITASDTRSNMLAWLANDLAASTKTWTVVFFHHPPYSKGSHNSDDPTDSGGRMEWMRANVLPVLENRGVDLVLSGHSHAYERSFFLDGHYGFSTSFNASYKVAAGSGRDTNGGAYTKFTLSPLPNGGTVYIVAGSGGQLSTTDPLNHPAMYSSQAVLGSLNLGFNANELNVRFITATGAIGDYFTIRKDPSRPRAPTGLTVSTAATSCARNVEWTAGSGALSHSLYRSEHPHQRGSALAQGLTTTSYTDSSASPGTTYYYSVRAINAAGTGPWSDLQSGVSLRADTDADGTADCVDECPNDVSRVLPGPCGCGKNPVGVLSNGSPNCGAPLSRYTKPSPPKVTRGKQRLRVVMDSYRGTSGVSYVGVITYRGRILKRFTSSSYRTWVPLQARGKVRITYTIRFGSKSRPKSTKSSAGTVVG